jgi:hypothetical protein
LKSADHWAKCALRHVRALSKRIGPRPATSDAERHAAEYVHDQLQRLGLPEVRMEAFQGATSAWMPWSIAFSLAAWGMLVGLLFDLVGAIIAAALYLSAAWIVYLELYPPSGPSSGHPVRRWLWRADSQNVLGVIPPPGTVAQRVVLLGYLDSARCPFLWRNQRRRRLVHRAAPLILVSLPISALAFLLGAWTGDVLFYFVAFLLLLPQIAALLASIRFERSPASPGANNNASGVGTLLGLAERLRETALTRTEVWLLATGCRETGKDGLYAFLEAHGTELTGTTLVALEGVGVGQRVVYLIGEGALRGTAYSPEALVCAARAAERCREASIPVSHGRHRGGPTETGILARSGLHGIAINVWMDDSPGVASRRQIDDTFETIQTQALAQAHTFAWALLQEIDASG